jgi:PAS domain S-box-containing protein
MTHNADEVARQRASGTGDFGISEASCRALLANVADMVTVSDRDGRIIYASPATRNVSGYKPEEFMRCDPFDWIHPEDCPRYKETLARLASNPGLSLELEHRVRHKNGTWRWVEATFTSLFDDPDVGGLIATVRDITGRKRTDEALRRASEFDAFRVSLVDALGPLFDPVEIQAEAARVLGEHLGANRVMYAEVEEDGITSALWTLLDTSASDGVVVDLSSSGDESLVPSAVGVQVNLVMREAISNALKHSGGVELGASLEIHPGELVNTVTDEGQGFDPEAAPSSATEPV